MTTYNSYEAAKIANPDKEIIRFDKQNEFKAVGNDELGAYLTTWTKCNPADHCMTVEKFLADGHKFELGDACLDDEGCVVNISVEEHTLNKPDEYDDTRFILRAAALETKEPKRTKVEYVQEKSFKEVLKCAIDGEVFYSKDGKGEFKFDVARMSFVNHDGADMEIAHLTNHEFYRRIETPIEWWEDAAEFMSELAEFSITEDGDLQVLMNEGDMGFGMSRDRWCDFARILLEQGE